MLRRIMMIFHNHIHDSASVLFGGVGIFVAFSSDTDIKHNLFMTCRTAEVSIGYTWNDLISTQKRPALSTIMFIM